VREEFMRVKLFWKNDPLGPRKGSLPADHAQALEDQINEWLAEHPGIRVVEVKQSASGESGLSLWLISIWYEEGTEPPAAAS
jgi:hypothetical protein